MDRQRRTFLKTILAVGGFLMVQKIVPSALLHASAHPPAPPTKARRGSFTVVEGGELVSVRDESGEEIFQIDNEA